MVDALVMVRGIARRNSTIKPAFPRRKSAFSAAQVGIFTHLLPEFRFQTRWQKVPTG
jgi:hypothetical protein